MKDDVNGTHGFMVAFHLAREKDDCYLIFIKEEVVYEQATTRGDTGSTGEPS
jgi:hypothetical protein